MDTCIITGATGYIGSHVLRHLLAKGWKIHIIADPKFGYANIDDVLSRIDVFEYDGNIGSLVEYFRKVNADVVFHLAAAVITNYTPEQVPTLIQSNIQFGTEILEAMRHSNVPFFVGTGSYWQNYDSYDYNPVDLYAATKEAFEKVLKYYVEAYGIRAISLRIFDVYGEDDRRPKLWTLLRDMAGSEKMIDLSPGEQRLDMVHISDVASAYEAAYNAFIRYPYINNEIYGVCTGNPRTLKEIVSIFQTIIGKHLNVNFGGRPYPNRQVMLPMQGYKVLPGWEAKVTLEEGFSKFKTL